MPPTGLGTLAHIVVLMMENRSFDHMLGALKAQDPRIDGLTGNESNPDTTGSPAPVKPQAAYQGQLDPDPDHQFPDVDLQIFDGNMAPDRVATMQGFVTSYFGERHDVKHSRQIMYYYKPEKLPVLTTLAREFALFNGWFSSIPGPTLCNRAFAHYGSSFGHVGMDIFYPNSQFKSIYQRLDAAGKTAKIYYFDTKSSTMEVVNLLQHQPQFFGDYAQFVADCAAGTLPDYSFVEPNYSDHDGDSGGPAGVGPAPRSRRPRGRALHRLHLQRDQGQPGPLGIDGAAHHLRRARRHLRSRAAAGLHAGRVRGAAVRHEDGQAVPLRPAGRAGAGDPRLALDSESDGRAGRGRSRRPGVRTRLDSRHGHRALHRQL